MEFFFKRKGTHILTKHDMMQVFKLWSWDGQATTQAKQFSFMLPKPCCLV
jgi:hypothetical protein